MYKKTNSTAIIRLEDGAFIPADSGNVDYAGYLEWVAEGNKPSDVDAPTLTQQIAAYEASAQSSLDAGAKAWGYDSIVSASSYAASSIPKFKAEALALIGWRDATWVAAETLLAAVQGGATPPATPAAFVAQMPAQPVRPA
jgi:hypothetical protein